MTRQDVLDFVNRNPVAFLATCDGNRPRVRGMLMYTADHRGIIFNTGKGKDVCRQLLANLEVELCFWSQDENRQVRVSGRAVPSEDRALKEEIVAKFDFLKPWVEKSGYDLLAPFVVKGGRATVWTMEANFAPKEYIEL